MQGYYLNELSTTLKATCKGMGFEFDSRASLDKKRLKKDCAFV